MFRHYPSAVKRTVTDETMTILGPLVPEDKDAEKADERAAACWKISDTLPLSRGLTDLSEFCGFIKNESEGIDPRENLFSSDCELKLASAQREEKKTENNHSSMSRLERQGRPHIQGRLERHGVAMEMEGLPEWGTPLVSIGDVKTVKRRTAFEMLASLLDKKLKLEEECDLLVEKGNVEEASKLKFEVQVLMATFVACNERIDDPISMRGLSDRLLNMSNVIRELVEFHEELAKDFKSTGFEPLKPVDYKPSNAGLGTRDEK